MDKIVIWDWNGTLLNDVEVNISILNTMLEKRGLKQIDSFQYKKLYRMPLMELCHDFGFTFETETFSQVANEYYHLYTNEFPKISLFSGCIEVLTEISNRNIKQYIVSAMYEPELINQVKIKGVFTFFDTIVGLKQAHAINKKERAIDLVNTFTEKQSIVFIGDMNHDYEAAQAIGAKCILYSKGHQFIKESSEYLIIDDLQKVIDHI